MLLMWCLKGKTLRRRPVALVGAACTSVIVGFALFNKVFISGQAQCLASCATAGVYQLLQKNEASKKIKHHRVRGFEVNFLGSNSPIEDRFVVGASNNLGSAFFSVIDGHKGTHCSHYLQNNMLQYVSKALHKASNIEEKDDLRIFLDMTSPLLYTSDSELEFQQEESINGDVTMESLQESLAALDDSFCNEALEDVKMILKGHSFAPEMRQRVLTAVEGACALTTVVRKEDIFVASTGDCRAVVGQQLSDHAWKAIQLSDDQNAQNEAEVKRLQEAHPGEQVIIGNRVLGSLMPFRTFGDVDFKWKKQYLEGLVNVWMNYDTPPYVTAEPVVTKRTIEEGDRFMIIGSDGLWERVSNEEAVSIVAESLKRTNTPKKRSFFFGSKSSMEECCEENAATKLLWHVLGGTEEKVTELLNIDSRLRRMYRDDITVIVVYF